MLLLLIFIAFSAAVSSSAKNDTFTLSCPEDYVGFVKDGVARCHNLTAGTYSYEEADRLCRSRGTVLSTIMEDDELLILKDEAILQGLEGKVMLRRNDEYNDTCFLLDVDDPGINSIMDVNCSSEDAVKTSAFSCMLPEPMECVTEGGAHKCKLAACNKGELSYYRKNGQLVCHKIITKPAFWQSAEKQCRQLGEGYRLASFEDSQEAESVMEMARRVFGCKREACFGTLWIGGRRQDSSNFEWEFDHTLSEIGPYNNFDEGEPDGDRRGRPEDCLAVFINEATYLDQHCTDDVEDSKLSYYEVRGFVCTFVEVAISDLLN